MRRGPHLPGCFRARPLQRSACGAAEIGIAPSPMTERARVFAMEPMFGIARDELVEHIPQCNRLGIRVVEIGPCRATMRLPWNEDLVGDPVRGVVFGGVITTLLDQASGVAVQCALPEFKT